MPKHISILLLTLLLSYSTLSFVRADEGVDEGDIETIVEHNLFHNDRQKWIMQDKPKVSQGVKKEIKKERKNLAKIELFGTVLSGDIRLAIVRSAGRKKRQKNNTFMEGDYIYGYLLKEIGRKKIVLYDDGYKEDFVIYLNEGKKKRAGAKTKIESPSRVKALDKKGKPKTRTPKPKKAKTAKFLKKRLQRDIKVLKSKDSRLVRKQAKKDWKKMQKLLPFVDEKERHEIIGIKKQLDAVMKD